MSKKTIDRKLDYIIDNTNRFRAVTALSAIVNGCRVRHIAALGVEYDSRDKLFTLDNDGYVKNIVKLDVLDFVDIIQDVFELKVNESNNFCNVFLNRGNISDKVKRISKIVKSNNNFTQLLSEFDAMHIRLFSNIIINDSGIGKAILKYKYPYTLTYVIDINDKIVDEFFVYHTKLGHMVNIKTSFGLWSIAVKDKDDLDLAVREYVDSFVLNRVVGSRL